ncbi:MAG: 16S rRNA (guanine(527)-N(7))-methyltransferase RsmG [Rhodoferax sp.]
MSEALEVPLRAGLQTLGLVLDDGQVAALLDYLALIQKWTRVYNLTAVRDPQEMLTHHLLDSLAVVGPMQRQLAALGMDGLLRVLDVGSGAGLPGVVLAICCPALTVHCVDTVAKKAAFVQQVAASLQLQNLRGIHARVESLTEPYDLVCSRAFASLVDFTTWSSAALALKGVWMAMKGKDPQAEIDALGAGVRAFHVEPLAVPGLAADRCLVWMRRA